MTNEEAIAIIQKEYLCVDRDCDIEKSCGKCDLMMPSKEPILEAYKMAIRALEYDDAKYHADHGEVIVDKAVWEDAERALKQEPCDDAISRQAVLSKKIYTETEEGWSGYTVDADYIEYLPSVRPQEPKTGHCKDCKWWRDSDGAYRRGVKTESQCPINRIEVFEGDGYCYMFEPQESEEV